MVRIAQGYSSFREWNRSQIMTLEITININIVQYSSYNSFLEDVHRKEFLFNVTQKFRPHVYTLKPLHNRGLLYIKTPFEYY